MVSAGGAAGAAAAAAAGDLLKRLEACERLLKRRLVCRRRLLRRRLRLGWCVKVAPSRWERGGHLLLERLHEEGGGASG